MNLELTRKQSLKTIDSNNEISIYSGQLTKKALAEQSRRILDIFPKFPVAMLNELKNAFAENGFTDERMRDAVNYVRDTYEGWDKLPNIANFIQFDQKVRLYTHQEVCEKNLWGAVKMIKCNDKNYWVRELDYEKIKHWVTK